MKFSITLEQRAFMVYALGNLGTGVLLGVISNPEAFSKAPFSYYIILPLAFVEFLLIGKMNFDAFKFGLVKGFCKNSKWVVTENTRKEKE